MHLVAIVQAFVKLISKETAKAALDGVRVPRGGIVPAIANRYTVRNLIENGEIYDIVTYRKKQL